MKAFFITLICICVLAIVGTGIYFFLSQEENDTANSEERVPPVQSQMPTEAKDKELKPVEKGEGASQLEELSGVTKDFLSTFTYEPYDEQIAYQNEELVKQIISDQHAYLNDLTGWGHIDNVDIGYLAQSEEWQQLQEDVERLRTEGFAPSEAVNDMWNAEAFMRIATDSADLNSLRYVHRIFHDIDAEINGAEVDKVWGATRAFGAETETQELYAYIKG
ncbi:hypothetical protein [Terribacillus saccharophilus]|uniref:Uncharacterized protein n=1 Tax=Terribacillus saccharophilus TaxID=361277 RepID=A0ABX4GZF9_9BACI|nr:hypothetical protein [Terribacillus saccharophilus]PAD36266.1 hypothetical protein CHH56_05060 [Terribacillus saccharophilus]PAD96695.1 hypothetical protein CHH50_07255 [Terribacillus saccharophilus]PAE00271.1 hypothetical protein CHH48_08160 [Terribacillus saccharophilus]